MIINGFSISDLTKTDKYIYDTKEYLSTKSC